MEDRRKRIVSIAAKLGLKVDLFAEWVSKLSQRQLFTSPDLLSDFICIRSELLPKQLRKNPRIFFKTLGFEKILVDKLKTLVRKFPHLSYRQVALTYIRSKILRTRDSSCTASPDTWADHIVAGKPTAKDVVEIEEPKVVPFYNCANFKALDATLLNLKTYADKNRKRLLFHGTTWTNANYIMEGGINIGMALPFSDFSVNDAFYMTDDFHQAHLSAYSSSLYINKDDPAIVIFGIPSDWLGSGRNHLNLQNSDFWQTLVNRCHDFTDTTWINQWNTFREKYHSIEGPASDPRSDNLAPKKNSWQLAIINEQCAKKMEEFIVGVIVWGQLPPDTSARNHHLW